MINGCRTEKIRAELLDKYSIKKCDIEIIDGSINCDNSLAIHKAGSVTFKYPDSTDLKGDKIKINYMTDKIKIYYVIDDIKYSLGEYMIINPKSQNNTVTASIMDLTCLIQRQRELTPVVFKKGTPYHDVLSYFIIKSGYINVNIEETDAVLQSDRVFDDTKNRLEWFNEVAKEINYTPLETDKDGYFVSKKYRQTTLSNVNHVYRIDKNSIISGDIEVEEDFWNVCNIVKCVHSNPNTPLLVSVARNDDPSDPFSTYSMGEVLLSVKIDNVADKQELDTIATKMLFEQRQVAQDITFNSLINPTHKLNDVIQLFSPDLEGIFLESSWTIPLKAGSLMTHKMRRLVDVRSVVE